MKRLPAKITFCHVIVIIHILLDMYRQLCYEYYINNTEVKSDIVRFGISLENELLDNFDNLIKRRKYSNRSEAIRDLIRQELLKRDLEEDREVAGAITFIYDHHQRNLLNKIIDVQHDYQDIIQSSQHIHLDHHNCLEIVALKGNSSKVNKLSDTLKALKGVMHGSLSMSSTRKSK
jgi:CopG family nickel-responsive transcriptional regulator